MAGAVMGGALGGPVGFMLGAAVAGNVKRIASTTGKLMAKVAAAGEAVLAGGRSVAMARGVTSNIAHSYDQDGPIQDPVERFQKIQQLAANEPATRNKIRQNLGDLAYIHPEVAQAVEDATMNRIKSISVRLPTFVVNAAGRTIMPGAGRMRQAMEYENAANDLYSILDSIGKGSLTRCQADALRECFPAVHAALLKQVFADPTKFATISQEQRAVMDKLTGQRMFSDPVTTLRHQNAWISANQANQPPQPGNGTTPQAFKIGSSATQNQSSNGAPGNVTTGPSAL
jgi:hypothetical protein